MSFLTDKAYKLSLAALSCFSAFVLLFGCVSCVFTALKSRKNGDAEAVSSYISDTAYGGEKIVSDTSPETFDSLIETLGELKYRYPDDIKIFTAGYSENGREILMYTLGSGEKKALIVGGVHAREHISTKYLLKVTEDYCAAAHSATGCYGEYNINSIFQEYTFYVIPCVNPDGLEIILSRDKAKSGVRISKLSEYKANANGVDINRNFPLAWESIDNGVTSPADYYFKGYSSASAKETQVLMSLCDESEFQFMLSFHIKGNLLYWGDNYKTYNNPLYKAFAEDIASACGFFVTEPTEKAENYGGGFENWFRHTYDRAGVCVELGDYKNKIKPCGDENYVDFYGFVNYEKSSFAIAAAAVSQNK